MNHAETFKAEVEAFLKRSQMKPTTFGKSAVGDPNFVRDLRKGPKPNLGLVDRVHEFIRSQAESAA
jgi:hypothetical protein